MLLFSKRNKIYLGYFSPEKFFLWEINEFRRDLNDSSSINEPLITNHSIPKSSEWQTAFVLPKALLQRDSIRVTGVGTPKGFAVARFDQYLRLSTFLTVRYSKTRSAFGFATARFDCIPYRFEAQWVLDNLTTKQLTSVTKSDAR